MLGAPRHKIPGEASTLSPGAFQANNKRLSNPLTPEPWAAQAMPNERIAQSHFLAQRYILHRLSDSQRQTKHSEERNGGILNIKAKRAEASLKIVGLVLSVWYGRD